MLGKRVIGFVGVVVCAGGALAHVGVPGHSHVEMGAAAQVLHGVMSWAPVVVGAVFAVWGVRVVQRQGR